MEYWIFFDLASGEELWRGSGTTGTAKMQPVPDGAGIIVVPQEAIAGPQVDLSLLRASVCSSVDAVAEHLRSRYLTPGAGQALVYGRKEAEARSWVKDSSIDTPFLSAEAEVRGISVEDLAGKVIEKADLWIRVGAVIEARRMAAKAAIASASNIGEIVRSEVEAWADLSLPIVAAEPHG